MTHGKHATYPRLGDEFAFVPPDQLIATCASDRDRAARSRRPHEPQARAPEIHDRRSRHRVVPQRGRSASRLHARARGARCPPGRFPTIKAGPRKATASGSTRSTSSAAASRIAARAKLKTALREIVAQTGRNLVATPNQSLLIIDVDAAQRATIDAILRANGVANDADEFERKALACPALPTCGLALAEAERFLPGAARPRFARRGKPRACATACRRFA